MLEGALRVSQAALEWPLLRLVGVELSATRHAIATTALRKLGSPPNAACRLGNMLAEPMGDATLVFAGSLLFDDPFMGTAPCQSAVSPSWAVGCPSEPTAAYTLFFIAYTLYFILAPRSRLLRAPTIALTFPPARLPSCPLPARHRCVCCKARPPAALACRCHAASLPEGDADYLLRRGSLPAERACCQHRQDV